MKGALSAKWPLLHQRRREKPKQASYWRSTLRKGMAAVCMILIINIAILGWVTQKDHDDGIAIIYKGSSKDAGTVFFWTHFVINIFSFLLLLYCNSCMQCLSSPTRKEIDSVHAKHDWLDIGVTSARNLLRINLWRGILWAFLALSSVPLSLFYNSVVFTSPAASDYLAVLVTPEFLDGGAYRTRPNGDEGWDHSTNQIKDLQDNYTSLIRLENSECRKAYDVPVQSNWSHVLLVSDYHSPNDTVIYTFWQSTAQGRPAVPGWIVGDAQNWAFEEPLCNGTFTYNWDADGSGGLPESCSSDSTYTTSNDIQRRQGFYSTSNTTTPTATSSGTVSASTTGPSGGFWTPPPKGPEWPAEKIQVRVQYCLALAFPNTESEVNLSITFLGVVIAFNVVKLLCLLGTLFLPRFDPLVTVGDSIASFLGAADLHTIHQGLLNDRQVTSGQWRKQSLRSGPSTPQKWAQSSLMLYKTVSPGQWPFNLALIIIIFVGGLAMLYVGSHWGRWDPGFWSEGLGEPNPALVIPGTIGWPLLGTVLLANVPQLAISCAYFSYNYLLTTMVMCREFSRYAASETSSAAKDAASTSTNSGSPLRVSEPVKSSQQIGNWQLSLPYAYSIPFAGAMVLLHWFVSQAIFAVRVGSYNLDGDQRSYNSGCGWSIKGIIASVVIGAAMIAALIALTIFGRLEKGAPIVGSCSVALAAACHSRSDDTGAELKMVSFGVLEDIQINGRNIGRVGFGSKAVRPLRIGTEYL